MRMRAEILDGMRDIMPPLIAAIPIGLLFGALSAAKGLSPAEVMLMGALVFAGGAQFAAVEIWQTPAPILAVAFSTAMINLRHVLMGASLAPKLGRFAPWQRFAGLAVMADENWALAERRAAARPLTAAYWLGMGAIFWANWVFFTGLGAAAGSFLGDPRAIGADFAFTALFIGLVAGFWKGTRTGLVIAASGAAAALAHLAFGPPWHVAAGAFAGLATAWLVAEDEPAGMEPAAETLPNGREERP